MDNVRPADAYWGRQDQILAQRQKIKSHRRPGANDVQTAEKRPTAVVIFFSALKWLKASLPFSLLRQPGRICPLLADDKQRDLS
ncbi:MAG TPA: hypothetical protein VK404_19165 [Spirosoma sp.]|nr:hypothetical protein [Spirosoma sp.]